MQQNMIFTESELNNNSLLRKMRSRFVYNNHMTIGEIMLRRAEIDANAAAKVINPVASAKMTGAHAEKKVKRVKAPVAKRAESPDKKSKKRIEKNDVASASSSAAAAVRHTPKRNHIIVACIGIFLFAALVLSFTLPMLSSDGISAQTVSAADNDYNAQSVSTGSPDASSSPVESDSSFDNVMSAFSYSFEKSAE